MLGLMSSIDLQFWALVLTVVGFGVAMLGYILRMIYNKVDNVARLYGEFNADQKVILWRMDNLEKNYKELMMQS